MKQEINNKKEILNQDINKDKIDMINSNDVDLIIENIKDIFYEEVFIDNQEQIPQIKEGLLFNRIEDYLKEFFNVKNNLTVKEIKEAIKEAIELEEAYKYPCLPYSKLSHYLYNRGSNWSLLKIDDFINLPNSIKKNFDDDLYWSSTPYDHQNYWAFSFKNNKKVIVNINMYCYVILKKN
jgi:hypothetical protein